MRIIQITDLHIGREGEDTHGVDVRSNFLRILETVGQLQPDHLVVSGDLCFREGQEEIYRWIRDQLQKLNIPFDLLSGNHDSPAMMARIFERESLLDNGEFYYTKKIGDQQILFLDTTPGSMSDKQFQWLEKQLSRIAQDVIVFMHHPPFPAGVPFMDDKHAFKQKDKIEKIFFNFPYNITVFTGHYHVEKTVRKKNVLVHITPSSFFQIDQHSSDFKVDHRKIGLREITLQNGTMMNTVRYV